MREEVRLRCQISDDVKSPNPVRDEINLHQMGGPNNRYARPNDKEVVNFVKPKLGGPKSPVRAGVAQSKSRQSGELHAEDHPAQLQDRAVAERVRDAWREPIPVQEGSVGAFQVGHLQSIAQAINADVAARDTERHRVEARQVNVGLNAITAAAHDHRGPVKSYISQYISLL